VQPALGRWSVAIALIGFFAFLILRMSAPQMTMLFSDLSLEDSSTIIKDLERQAIPFQLRNEGATILVPHDRVTRLRMKLAEGGLPKGGGVGYEIFDRSDTLGSTSFVQNVNHLRALEGELARTIRRSTRTDGPRAPALPERQLFSRDRPEASASIVLRVRGMLEPQQVRAIRHLIASAVNGLKPERVSVVDESGRLLADGARSDNAMGVTADERQIAFERRLRDQVDAIVTSVVGPGRARVQLTADFDFNRVTQTSERYDPEGRVLRSSQTREESSASAASQDGQVTVGTNAGAQRPGDANPRPARAVQDQRSSTTRFRVRRTEITEGGWANRISVAVLVDATTPATPTRASTSRASRPSWIAWRAGAHHHRSMSAAAPS
jgi:flagellar M-ring protein FliF